MSEPSGLSALERDIGQPGLFPREVVDLYDQGLRRKAWALLRRWIRSEAPGPRRAQLTEYLGQLRLWAEPVVQPPMLPTLNGVGLSMYGKHQPDPSDQTQIATVWFVFLFIPLFPLASYLVRPGQREGLRRTWAFFARVPLPPLQRRIRALWGVGLVLGVLALCGAGALGVWYQANYLDVEVINGYLVPVVVRIGDREQEIAPLSHIQLERVPLGSTQIESRFADFETPFESFEVEPLAWPEEGRWLYNPASRAVLNRYWVGYGNGTPPDDELLPLYSLQIAPEVDHWFEEPPDQLNISEGGYVERSALVRLEEPEGAEGLVHGLIAYGLLQNAATLVSAERLMRPTDGQFLQLASTFIEPSEVLAWADEAIALDPEQVLLHEVRGSLLLMLGGDPIKEYRARLDEQPDDLVALLGLAGLVLPEEALPLYQRAAELAPGRVEPVFGLARMDELAGRWSEAADGYAEAVERDPLRDPLLRLPRARILRLAGRVDEARALIDSGAHPDFLLLSAHWALAAGELTPAGALEQLLTRHREQGLPTPEGAAMALLEASLLVTACAADDAQERLEAARAGTKQVLYGGGLIEGRLLLSQGFPLSAPGPWEANTWGDGFRWLRHAIGRVTGSPDPALEEALAAELAGPYALAGIERLPVGDRAELDAFLGSRAAHLRGIGYLYGWILTEGTDRGMLEAARLHALPDELPCIE